MHKPVIEVKHISKRYRIGGPVKKEETFAGQVLNTILAPIKNLKNIRNLNRFNEDDETTFWALRDINFEVQQGEVLGIIGHNGAGKSTLLKLLSRITEPSTGEIILRGRVNSLLEVGTGFHPDLSGRDNIYMNGTILGMTKKEIDCKLDEIIDFSGVARYIDTPVKRYSSGMTVRLAFSVAAHLEPEILIIDEVLAVGDVEFQKKCLGKMKEVSGQGRTVLFVSHNMGAVKNLCSRGLLLKAGQIKFIGDVESAIKAYVLNRQAGGTRGIIQEHMRTSHSGEAFIRRLTLIEQDEGELENLLYKDELRVKMEVEVLQFIKDILIDIKVISGEGMTVAHSLNSIAQVPLKALNTGKHTILISMSNQLAPGNYSLTAGIHYPNGMTVEYVEDVYPFTILKVAKEEGHSYPYEWVHGYHHPPTKWKLVE